MILHGECIDELQKLESNSIDSLVTDPPAGISFMGKTWDADHGGRDHWIAWLRRIMQECHRVMKPGAHGLVWALPRTSHWTATALEDAGFEVKDQLSHAFGSGFPKSLNVRKAAEKQGICCVCTEEMRDLRSAVDAEKSVSGDTQQDVQSVLRREADSQDRAHADKASSDLPDLQKDIRTQEQYGSIEGEVLFPEVRRCNASLAPGVCCSPSGDCTQHEGTQGDAAVWPCQSLVEGRSHLQAQQGELRRAEVRPVSCGLPSDGSQGRLHHGAPARDGADDLPDSHPNRSRASQGPQHQKQRSGQSGTLAEQRSAQARGAWSTCHRCSKPILPEGLGTALKPAHEVWWLIRKPLSEKTVSANVLKHGTGALNVDGCRVGDAQTVKVRSGNSGAHGRYGKDDRVFERVNPPGRFPANLIVSGTARDVMDEQSGIAKPVNRGPSVSGHQDSYVGGKVRKPVPRVDHSSDAGGASRFFADCADAPFYYVAKPSKREKNAGCEGMPERNANVGDHRPSGNMNQRIHGKENRPDVPRANFHPTVKPLKLMRYLAKLVTPPGGTVLDPFLGSGTTAVAAIQEGFRFIGIEREQEYVAIATARVEHATSEPEQVEAAL